MNMTSKEHISQSLAGLKVAPTAGPQDPSELADVIYHFLMSKKFRKYSVSPDYQKHILGAIQASVAKNEPIKLTLVFGGYKLWRLAETPEVDWAELFAVTYYAKWLQPILAIYRPGVWFDFFSDDVVLETINNIPRADTEQYATSFRKLLAFLKPYLPANLNFTLYRLSEQYASRDEFQAELAESLEKIKADFAGGSLSTEQMATVELNVKLKPGQADDPQWREQVNLLHEAYTRVPRRRAYYRVPDKILIITRPLKSLSAGTLAVGTTKRSVIKFWIGAGVLGQEGDGYVDYIFSPHQLEQGSFKEEAISLDGLVGKNFQKIRIIKD